MFQVWLENRLDKENRQKSIDLANLIISIIENNSVVDGLPISVSSKGIRRNRTLQTNVKGALFDIGEYIPEFPNLKLQFINQAGFGKNKDAGLYLPSKGIIAVEIPHRTLYAGNYIYYPIDNKDHYRLPYTVVKWLKKPEIFHTLIHELVHYIDDIRTNGKIFKRHKTEEQEEYYNRPSEYNAFLQEFISKIANQNFSLSNVIELLKNQTWFQHLNDNLKRNAIKRIYNYFQENIDFNNKKT